MSGEIIDGISIDGILRWEYWAEYHKIIDPDDTNKITLWCHPFPLNITETLV